MLCYIISGEWGPPTHEIRIPLIVGLKSMSVNSVWREKAGKRPNENYKRKEAHFIWHHWIIDFDLCCSSCLAKSLVV